jgi:hypothetical protein
MMLKSPQERGKRNRMMGRLDELEALLTAAGRDSRPTQSGTEEEVGIRYMAQCSKSKFEKVDRYIIKYAMLLKSINEILPDK